MPQKVSWSSHPDLVVAAHILSFLLTGKVKKHHIPNINSRKPIREYQKRIKDRGLRN
jgi:hypothetical protein